MINYSCSHDEVRPEHEIIFYSRRHITLPAGMNLHELARRKALLGLIALFGAPGIPMLYSGQEFAEDTPRTIDFQPLHWGKLQQALYADYAALVGRLIRARRSQAALQSDHIRFYANDFAQEQVVRFDRFALGPDGTTVTDFAAVALNFGERRQQIELTLPWAGRWRDLVTNQVRQRKAGPWQTTLGPWQGLLLLYEGS